MLLAVNAFFGKINQNGSSIYTLSEFYVEPNFDYFRKLKEPNKFSALFKETIAVS